MLLLVVGFLLLFQVLPGVLYCIRSHMILTSVDFHSVIPYSSCFYFRSGNEGLGSGPTLQSSVLPSLEVDQCVLDYLTQPLVGQPDVGASSVRATFQPTH